MAPTGKHRRPTVTLFVGLVAVVFASVVITLMALVLSYSSASTADVRPRLSRAAPAAAAMRTAAPRRVDDTSPTAAAPDVPQARSAAQGACEVHADTELGGDVVRWGAEHRTPTADECCGACSATPRCNVWVWCGSAGACGASHLQCWLKALDEPWGELEVLAGKSSRWSSGIVGTPREPARGSGGGAELPPPDFAIVTEAGEARVRIFADAAPNAAAFVRGVLRAAPSCTGCNFYRAEPVPAHWGSKEWPDSWNGGRWGPPYALLQGSFLPAAVDAGHGGALPARPAADQGQKARPLIRRGMLAWAGGGGGSDAFIALAEHPEWGHGHTVWGEVLAEDMAVIDRLMSSRPIKTQDWGTIQASVFEKAASFSLRPLRDL